MRLSGLYSTYENFERYKDDEKNLTPEDDTSEYNKLISEMSRKDMTSLLLDLMQALEVVNPKLFSSVIEKIK